MSETKDLIKANIRPGSFELRYDSVEDAQAGLLSGLEKEESLGVVIYTDGSARPNPGIIGSGIHGYFFAFEENEKKQTKINTWIPTNKGYIAATAKMPADAKRVRILKYFDIAVPYDKESTNNFAEVNAVVFFLEFMKTLPVAFKEVFVLADSEYTKKSISYLPAWKNNGWTTGGGKPVANLESWKKMDQLLAALRQTTEFNIDYVPAHAGDLGNTRADFLSVIGGRIQLSDELGIPMIIYYGKACHMVKRDANPLLNMRRIYFNNNPDYNVPGCYMQAGIEVGKRSSEGEFSIVKLNEPDEAIEAVKDAQYLIETDYNRIMYLKMDVLFSSLVYQFSSLFGQSAFSKQIGRSVCLEFLDRTPVTFEVQPTELPLRTVAVLNQLQGILDEVEDRLESGGVLTAKENKYSIEEITHHFYKLEEKKRGKEIVQNTVIKETIGVGIKDIVVTGTVGDGEKFTKLQFPLLFGLDLPDRNAMKRIESDKPEVFLITWKASAKSFQYAVVVKTTEMIGIWSNYYASQIFTD